MIMLYFSLVRLVPVAGPTESLTHIKQNAKAPCGCAGESNYTLFFLSSLPEEREHRAELLSTMKAFVTASAGCEVCGTV
ncbi:uncharacterized [Tachysurus ichikawai]